MRSVSKYFIKFHDGIDRTQSNQMDTQIFRTIFYQRQTFSRMALLSVLLLRRNNTDGDISIILKIS